MSGIVISGDTRGGVGGPAQRKAPAAGAYKAAVAGVLTRLTQAWNKADPRAVGALFGKEADYVNMGGQMVSGADKIAVAHKQLFDSQKGAASAYRIIKLKPLGPEVVLAFLGQKITLKQDGKDATITTRPTMVLRKAGNDWKIAAFQVTRVGPQVAARARAAAAQKAAPAKAAAAKSAPAKAAEPAKASKSPAKKADKK
jgi:uncharacterized protein (TIGR02246 family)